MKKMKSLLLLGITVIFIAVIYLAAEHDHGKKKLSISVAEKVTSMDPAVAFDDYTLTVTGQIYESLFDYHYLKRPYEIVPVIASDYPQYLDSGKTIRISIKKNVHYHDHPAFKGQKRFVKAQDFVNQIKRLAFKPLNSPGTWFFAEKLKGFKDFQDRVGDNWENIFTENLEGIQAVDDYTLDFHFIQKEIQSIHYLTMTLVIPLPEEVIRYNQNDFSKNTCGTGPFILDRFSQKQFTLKRNIEYRDVKYPTSGDRFANTKKLLRDQLYKIPFLDEITINVIADEKESWEQFLDKKIDILIVPQTFKDKFISSDGFVPEEIEAIAAEVSHSPSLSVRWLSFNMNDPLWGTNKKLRQAIAYAIDIDLYIKQVVDSSKLAANSIFNPGINGYRPQKMRPYSYSIEKAKLKLEEAGYKDGVGLPELHFYTRTDKAHQVKFVNYLKTQLAQIGIKLVPHIQSFREYLKLARSPNNPMQFWLDGWIYDYPDPENILQLLISSNGPGLNKSRYKSLEYDKAYKNYVSSSLPLERAQYLKRAEEIVDEDLPWIMLSYESNLIVVQRRVQNFRWSSIIRNYFKYLDVED